MYLNFLKYKKIAVYLLLAIFFVAIDRFLKILSFEYFRNREISLFGDLLKFDFAKNYNIAFSLPITNIVIMATIPLIVGFLFYYGLKLAKSNDFHSAGLLTIIIFGAISNYVDRLKFGFVIDYIDLKYFTVFNVADSMIVVASMFLLFMNLNLKKQ